MKQTVLLTGAGGFLAGHCVAAFAEGGYRRVGIGRSDPHRQAVKFDAFVTDDLSDPARILSVLDRYAPDVVIHLAAPSSVPLSLRNPVADFAGHVTPAIHLFDALRLARSEARVILVSSAAVYGEPRALPVAETAPLAPISPYGFHKLHQELLVDEYAVIHGLRCCKARIFSTYGENLRRLAVWEIARRALAGDRRVHGTGDETRDYLYAGDVGRALVTIAENAEFRGEAVNVASGEGVPIRALAAAIFRALGIAGSPEFTGAALPGNPAHWRADVSRLHALGFSAPAWTASLPRVLEWIRREAQ
jgi:UDP-glucose 4-epimerase